MKRTFLSLVLLRVTLKSWNDITDAWVRLFFNSASHCELRASIEGFDVSASSTSLTKLFMLLFKSSVTLIKIQRTLYKTPFEVEVSYSNITSISACTIATSVFLNLKLALKMYWSSRSSETRFLTFLLKDLLLWSVKMIAWSLMMILTELNLDIIKLQFFKIELKSVIMRPQMFRNKS